MIGPQFLSQLRQKHRAEMVLVLVQLEQIAPCWHQSISDLALEIGTDRATLNRSLSCLRKLGLLQYYSASNGGCWIWWVKRCEDDAPDPNGEPCWQLRSSNNHATAKIPISKRREWAAARGIPLATLNSFLLGRHAVLRNHWRITKSPFDLEIKEQLQGRTNREST